MHESIKAIYAKFVNGDSISDDELRHGHDHFSRMADLLSISGPVFHLAFCEANRVAMRFHDYMSARKG